MASRRYVIPIVVRKGVAYVRGTDIEANSATGIAMVKARAAKNSKVRQRTQGRAPGSYWRIQDNGSFKREVTARRFVERFDEVVVDTWLHVEALDTRSFYACLAGLYVWFTVSRSGRIVVTHAELSDDVVSLPGALTHVLNQLAGRSVPR